MQTIITYIITTIAGLIIGNLYQRLIHYKQSLKLADKTDLLLLKNNLTNTFYAYEQIGQIPDYVLEGWLEAYRLYKEKGGNTYVDVLYEKITKFKIVHTEILV